MQVRHRRACLHSSETSRIKCLSFGLFRTVPWRGFSATSTRSSITTRIRPNFVEVLKRFVAHRGTWLGETYDRKTTARDWVYRVNGMALLDDPYVANLHVLEISLVAKRMLDLHTQHHVPGAPDPKTTYNDLNRWVDVSRPYLRMLLGLSDEEYKRICTQIKDTAGSCRRGAVHSLTRWEFMGGLSEWPITQIVEYGTHYRTNQKKFGGFGGGWTASRSA